MVDEFSRFARMPKPVMTAGDVADTVRQVVFLQRVGNADIAIDLEIAEDPMPAHFDRRLISQALTNIIKNATEAIAAVPAGEHSPRRVPLRARRICTPHAAAALDTAGCVAQATHHTARDTQ